MPRVAHCRSLYASSGGPRRPAEPDRCCESRRPRQQRKMDEPAAATQESGHTQLDGTERRAK